MSTLPAALRRHSGPWWWAVGITVIGDLAGMLATFLPMKAILILAGGGVPGFFPQFMIDRGEVFSALSLLAAAGVFGATAWLAELLIKQLDRGPTMGVQAVLHSVDPRSPQAVQARKLRQFESSLVLIVPVAAVLVLVSAFYLGLAVVWIVVSALVVAERTRRTPRQAPYLSGLDHFSHNLRDWLKSSALWSMVGLALITLLVAPPPLGSTAVLIAAIFGRRLIVAVAEIVPDGTRSATSATGTGRKLLGSLVTNPATTTSVRWPIEFFSSEPGSRILGQFLEAQGYPRSDYRVIGPPTGPSLSIVVSPSESRQLLLRVFRVDSSDARDREFYQRTTPEGYSLFPPAPAVASNLGGFPTIVISLDHPDSLVDLEAPAARDAHIGYQVSTEWQSMLAFRQEPLGASLGIDQAELTDRINAIGRIPGPHRAACRAVLPYLDDVLARSERIPVGLVPSVTLNPAQFYVSQSGAPCYLGGPWSVGRLGDRWGATGPYRQRLDQVMTEFPAGLDHGRVENQGEEAHVTGDQPGVNLDDVACNAELHALDRALRAFQFDKAEAAATALLERLRNVS